jgi:hypothetical protein
VALGITSGLGDCEWPRGVMGGLGGSSVVLGVAGGLEWTAGVASALSGSWVASGVALEGLQVASMGCRWPRGFADGLGGSGWHREVAGGLKGLRVASRGRRWS